jgi:hypothetical protein
MPAAGVALRESRTTGIRRVELSPRLGQSNLDPANQPQASVWGAFLCDDDGLVIRDFGESISADVLVNLTGSGSLMTLLEKVRSQCASSGWETTIQFEGSPRRLLVHSARTLQGTFVFATLSPSPAHPLVKPPAESGEDVELIGTGKFNCPVSAAIGQCPVCVKQEEEYCRFVTAAVHELRNPISSIIGSCEYLEGYCGEDLEPDQVEVIHAIQSAAATLLKVSARISELCAPK